MADSRTQLEQQIDDHWVDLAQEAHVEGKTLATKAQEISPEPDDDDSPNSASGDYLMRKGIALRDNPLHGIKSAPMKKIFENDSKEGCPEGLVWADATREAVLGGLRGWKEGQRERKLIMLNDGSMASYTPGSAIRPYINSPLYDSDMIVEYPPLERIAGSVVRQQGDSIRNVEYQKDPLMKAAGDPPYEIAEGSDIPLRVPQVKETTGGMTIIADGLKITAKLRQSTYYTSEMVMLEAEKHAVQVAQRMGAKAIDAAFTGATDTDVGALTHDDLIDLVFQLDPPYQVTSIFGAKVAAKRYVSVDRDSLYNPSASQSVMGSVVGSDMFGRAIIGRMIYDVFNTKLNETANEQKLLCMDAREVVDVNIREGSDMSTDTFNPRNRCYELAWDIEFGVKLRTKNPKARFVLTTSA